MSQTMNRIFAVREEIFRSNGKTCGYPECCIDAFVERARKMLVDRVSPNLIPLTEDQVKASNQSGFIPCPSCAKKVMEGLPLESLINGRDELQPPFPDAY